MNWHWKLPPVQSSFCNIIFFGSLIVLQGIKMFEEILLRREFLLEGQRVPPVGKKTTLVKMLAKLIFTLPHPGMYSHFFFHDLKELDILVRSSAGIILMYYFFAFATTNLRPTVYVMFSPLYIYWNFGAKRTVMLCSLSCYARFFAASRVLILSKPSGTFYVVFCRLMFRFVIVIIVVGSWL